MPFDTLILNRIEEHAKLLQKVASMYETLHQMSRSSETDFPVAVEAVGQLLCSELYNVGVLLEAIQELAHRPQQQEQSNGTC
jgi:hypothetical protein